MSSNTNINWNTNASSRNLRCPIVGLTAMEEAGTKSDNVESFSNLGNSIMAECPILIMKTMMMRRTILIMMMIMMMMITRPVEDTSRPWVGRMLGLKHSCKAPRCPLAHLPAWQSSWWRGWWRWHYKGTLIQDLELSSNHLVQLFSNQKEDDCDAIWWGGVGIGYIWLCNTHVGNFTMTKWRSGVKEAPQWSHIHARGQFQFPCSPSIPATSSNQYTSSVWSSIWSWLWS